MRKTIQMKIDYEKIEEHILKMLMIEYILSIIASRM